MFIKQVNMGLIDVHPIEWWVFIAKAESLGCSVWT